MQIHYLGLTSFKIVTKEATLIIDPFSSASGLTSVRGNADIVVLSEKDNELYSATSGISGTPFLINDPGEYDTKGVTVTGLPLKFKDGYIIAYLLEAEDLKILSLAHIPEFIMKEDDLESLGDIDILLLPVGGNGTIAAGAAASLVKLIEPKVVIPTHYQMPGLKLAADPLEKFLKEMGNKHETVDKLTLKKKDLSEEQTKVIVIEPNR